MYILLKSTKKILLNIVRSRHNSGVPLLIYSVLALLRMGIIALLIVGFPQLESHDGWYFHHGGDQNYYFDFGLVLARGTYEQYFSVNLGLPAIMAIIIRLFGSLTFSDLLPHMVLLNGFLFGGLSVIVIGRLTARLLHSEDSGYIAAFMWAIMPWLLWLLIWPHPQASWMRMPYVPGVAWLQGVPDGPGVFFALVSTYFLVQCLESHDIKWVILSAIATGVMLMFRVHFATLILLGLLVIGMQRRWWDLLLFPAVAAIVYIPQVFYNRLASLNIGTPGYNPWLPGYLYFGVIDVMAETAYYYDNSVFNMVSVDHFINTIQILLTSNFVLLLAIVLVFVFYVWSFYRTGQLLGWVRSIILFGAPPTSIGIVSFSSILVDNAYRFALPSIPFLVVLVSWGITVIARRSGKSIT